MKTLVDLTNLNGRVYVYLKTRLLSGHFLQNAEDEGFTFCDGVLPTNRHESDIFALNKDRTINYVGFCGHVAFQAAGTVSQQRLIKVDYERFLNGNVDFFI